MENNKPWKERRKERIFLEDGRSYGYDALHTRLRSLYGNAKECKNCGVLNAKRYEWALIKGKSYSLNIYDYFQLCKSCHIKYDITDKSKMRISESKIGKEVNTKAILMLFDNIPIKVFKSLKDAESFTGTGTTSISNNLLKISKKTRDGHRFEYF